MCLILFAYQHHPRYALILAANRDEYYQRPTRAAGFWPEAPQLLAGKDLQAGGTWLGITRHGRFAAVTNYRDGRERREPPRSRGSLVRNFLLDSAAPEQFAAAIAAREATAAGGFNLLLGTLTGTESRLYYTSNRGGPAHELDAGLHGLSNHFLNTPWPKVQSGRAAFQQLLDKDTIEPAALLNLLSDRHVAPDAQLPDTGISRDWERLLSSCFIVGDQYGTRSSTALLVARNGRVEFWEQRFRGGVIEGVEKVTFQIEPE